MRRYDQLPTLPDHGRVDRIHPGDRFGHVREIQAAAESRFNDNTFDAPQTLLAPCTDVVGAECQIDEPREQLISPKGHHISMTGDQFDHRLKSVRQRVVVRSAHKPGLDAVVTDNGQPVSTPG